MSQESCLRRWRYWVYKLIHLRVMLVICYNPVLLPHTTTLPTPCLSPKIYMPPLTATSQHLSHSAITFGRLTRTHYSHGRRLCISNHLLASYTTTVALPVLDRIDYGLTVPQYPSIVRIAWYHNRHIHTFIAHLRHTDTPVGSTAYTLTFLFRPYALPPHCITNIPILYTRR